MGFFNSLTFTLISFVAFTILVAVISYFKSKGVSEGDESGYYLAGRSLSGVVIAGSLIMTDLSAMQLVGNNGQSVIVGMGVFAAQGLGYSGMILAALLLIPRYLKSGVTTMPQFYEMRYDKFTRNLITIIMMVNYVVVMLPSALYAGAQVFIRIFHFDELFDLSYFGAIVILCIIIAIVGSIYAICGGLKAIAVSDTINGIGMLVGGFLVTFFGLCFLSNTLGGDGTMMDGLEKFVSTKPELMNAINEAGSNEPWWPWPVLFSGLVINNLYYWGCDQAIVQRAFGAKSMAQAQKGMILAGLLTMLTPIFLVMPGVIANLAYPDIDWYANGDAAFPMLISDCMPKVFLGFFAACVFGAVLSTFNSFLNSASTIFAINIYQGTLHPEATDQDVIKVGKQFGTIVTIVSTVISPFLLYAGGIFTWVNSAIGIFSIPILVLTILAVYSKRTPRNIGRILIPFHIVAYVLVNYILPHFIPFFGKVFYMYWYVLFFALDFLIAWIATKRHPLEEDYVWKENPPKGMEMKPWKWRKVAIIATLCATAVFYIVFSPLCLGKSKKTTWQQYQEYEMTNE